MNLLFEKTTTQKSRELAGQLLIQATAASGNAESIQKLMSKLQGEDPEESGGDLDRLIASKVF